MEGVEVVLGLWTIGQKVTDKTLAEGFTGRAWYTGQDPGRKRKLLGSPREGLPKEGVSSHVAWL